jgi:hypothetical protein
VRLDEQAKVLDFGLGRLADPDSITEAGPSAQSAHSRAWESYCCQAFALDNTHGAGGSPSAIVLEALAVGGPWLMVVSRVESMSRLTS